MRLLDAIDHALSSYVNSTIKDCKAVSTYPSFRIRVLGVAENLSLLAAKRKCVVLCNSQYNTALSILSCWYSGHIPIPLSELYGSTHTRKILDLIQPDLIITDYSMESSIPLFNIADGSLSSKPNENIDSDLSDTRLIMCTSGTTGVPKGAMLSADNLLANVLDIADYFEINTNDTIYIARPLYHCAVLTGEFLISLIKGTSIIFNNDKIDPLSINKSLASPITTMCGTPTIFYYLAKQKIRYPLKNIVLSGERLNNEVAKTIAEAYPEAKIYNVYGLTEASPRVSYLSPELFTQKIGSVGLPLKSLKAEIRDQFLNQLPSGQTGTLWINGPSVMLGYYRNPGQTNKVIHDSWLNTGDVAYKDADGAIYIESRADNMIIRGGLNIYPEEIEGLLASAPELSETLAYGVDASPSQLIYLDIVLSDAFKNVNYMEAISIISANLPQHLLPNKVFIVDSIPKNASGKKIRKRG